MRGIQQRHQQLVDLAFQLSSGHVHPVIRESPPDTGIPQRFRARGSLTAGDAGQSRATAKTKTDCELQHSEDTQWTQIRIRLQYRQNTGIPFSIAPELPFQFRVSASFHIQPLSDQLDVDQAVACFAREKLPLVLDSAGPYQAHDARYTFLTADPVATVRLDSVKYGDQPFETLRRWQSLLPPTPSAMPPFCGGIAGLLSYEAGHAFERLPRVEDNQFKTPALLAGLYDWAIVWDHLEPSVRLCVIELDHIEGRPSKTPAERITWVQERLSVSREILSDVSDESTTEISESGTHDLTASYRQAFELPSARNVHSGFSREDYTTAVERVIEYIRAGDIFQANLSQQITAPWNRDASSLFQQVRRFNAAPFCGMFIADDFAVISASPERFLRVRNGRDVETRPIKGTRRRQQSPIADLYTGNELSTSEKDRAENVMIVDLLRNDLSRVCEAGSVRVPAVCEIEVFETVQHLVSTVIGRLKPDCDVWDLFAAAIPGGSITGAPKIRAMEIISELEPAARGAYCGNLFYVGPGGSFDSNILIRTFVLRNGAVQFPVGGGIVADSDPDDEYKETLHKAAGMLRCLELNGDH